MYIGPTTMRGLADTSLDYSGIDTGTDPSTDASIPDWANKLLDFGQNALSVYNTQQIRSANIELAKQGKPPLDQSAYAPQFNVGLSQDTKNLMIALAIGLPLLFLLMRGRR